MNARLIGKYINKLYAVPTAMNEFDNSAIIRIGEGLLLISFKITYSSHALFVFFVTLASEDIDDMQRFLFTLSITFLLMLSVLRLSAGEVCQTTMLMLLSAMGTSCIPMHMAILSCPTHSVTSS